MDSAQDLVEAVVAALERDDPLAAKATGDVAEDLAVELAEALVREGLRARCEAPPRGGGRAELLVTTDAPGSPTSRGAAHQRGRGRA